MKEDRLTLDARWQDALATKLAREKIVYLLGAGFSAPLGLPVMKEFYGKSHELRRQRPNEFKYFDQVFEFVRRTGEVSGYYKSTDVLNIEQTLSMLDMVDQLDGVKLRETITRYISDVISASTPSISPRVYQINSAMDRIFWEDRWYPYAAFISAIFHIRFKRIDPVDGQPTKYEFEAHEPLPQNDYSVITLNYDRVLENVRDFLNEHYAPINLQFARNLQSAPLPPNAVYLAKLHGSVGAGEDIIPPTWRKDFASDRIRSSWQLARDLLRNANQVRIVGYSLPESDSYIKDLMRVAAIDGSNLKHIDVLCRDSKGDVRQRYKEFIGSEERFRFRDLNVASYLWMGTINSEPPSVSSFDSIIEWNHKQVFDKESI